MKVLGQRVVKLISEHVTSPCMARETLRTQNPILLIDWIQILIFVDFLLAHIKDLRQNYMKHAASAKPTT